jgi:CelD/BcsL family acetyltransferase involved in cellulose biosynthesis
MSPLEGVELFVVGWDGGAHEAALIAAWRGLAEMRGNPFLTPEWFRAWQLAAPAETPYLLVWRRGGEVAGVLPLVQARVGPLRRLRFAGSRLGDWFTPACRAEDEEAMAAACAAFLDEHRGDWQLLEMTRIDSGSAWPAALWEAGPGRIGSARPRRVDPLPFIRFGEDGFEGYMAAKSGNFRHHMRRHRRKLEREHGLEFRMTAAADRVAADLETCFSLHEARWQQRGGSQALPADARRAHHDFAAVAFERGWLRLCIAELDGEPAAALYGWRIGDRYCAALTGLLPSYERHSLGTVLFAHTIEQAAGEGAGIYDFLRGDESYKSRFETGRRDAESWVLGRRGHPVALTSAGSERLVALGRRLPSGPRSFAKRAYRAVVKV